MTSATEGLTCLRLLSQWCCGSAAPPFCSGAVGTSSATWFISFVSTRGRQSVGRQIGGLLFYLLTGTLTGVSGFYFDCGGFPLRTQSVQQKVTAVASSGGPFDALGQQRIPRNLPSRDGLSVMERLWPPIPMLANGNCCKTTLLHSQIMIPRRNGSPLMLFLTLRPGAGLVIGSHAVPRNRAREKQARDYVF
jgi:hypothetical protein